MGQVHCIRSTVPYRLSLVVYQAPMPSPPMHDLEKQVNGFRTGRPNTTPENPPPLGHRGS